MNNRERLIKEASLQIAEHGYQGFTMDTVLARTGVAKSNAYYHFPTKDQLGREVLHYWCNLFLQFEKNTLIDSSFTFLERLSNTEQRYLAFQQKARFPGDIPGLLAVQLHTDETKQTYRTYLTERHIQLTHFFASGKKSDQFLPTIHPDSCAWLYIHLISGAGNAARIEGSLQPLLRAFGQIRSLVINEGTRLNTGSISSNSR